MFGKQIQIVAGYILKKTKKEMSLKCGLNFVLPLTSTMLNGGF